MVNDYVKYKLARMREQAEALKERTAELRAALAKVGG